MKINDVSEAWGAYVLAREYLVQHAPHLLIETLSSKATDPVVGALYADLVELVAIKDKIKWAIGQEEQREVDDHVMSETSQPTLEERVSNLESMGTVLEDLETTVKAQSDVIKGLNKQLAKFQTQLAELEPPVQMPKDEEPTQEEDEWKPTQAQIDQLVKEFQEAEYDPLGGWITKVAKDTEGRMKQAANHVRECLKHIPNADPVYEAASKELDELVDAAGKLGIDLRTQAGSLLDKAAKAVTPKKPRAPRKPRATKPTE